jgi:hypothetical protein
MKNSIAIFIVAISTSVISVNCNPHLTLPATPTSPLHDSPKLAHRPHGGDIKPTKLPAHFDFAQYQESHSEDVVNAFLDFVNEHSAPEIEQLVYEIELIENLLSVSDDFDFTDEEIDIINIIEDVITSLPKKKFLFNFDIESFVALNPENTALLIAKIIELENVQCSVKDFVQLVKDLLLREALTEEYTAAIETKDYVRAERIRSIYHGTYGLGRYDQEDNFGK